jgi:DNA invertase Pin-like site-specific DNA recombinase
VQDHRESAARQYELQGRAHALGWTTEQTVVIDEDQGLSDASAAARPGFQRRWLRSASGTGASSWGWRSPAWPGIPPTGTASLEICALAETLILAEDGLYDPSQFNDRLLLGPKGTMSEAELHVLRARLLGGTLHKSHRGGALDAAAARLRDRLRGPAHARP